ncbi:hypothetical protein O9G_002434 [Rozella allomycis CSF55]|uniref:Uncharacterized protein n=1 Tax=Rozella allomycis (strain CSF55) TaxID=988480 RepID=A0A075B1J0_ROZAC|nr:hypothetical protein O9G_002434 [Rozella allomycis CSF55]|eukprot:EPZ34836.1 hypothetical protein O9G_002434 [Rozella allomycis CSF55]
MSIVLTIVSTKQRLSGMNVQSQMNLKQMYILTFALGYASLVIIVYIYKASEEPIRFFSTNTFNKQYLSSILYERVLDPVIGYIIAGTLGTGFAVPFLAKESGSKTPKSNNNNSTGSGVGLKIRSKKNLLST